MGSLLNTVKQISYQEKCLQARVHLAIQICLSTLPRSLNRAFRSPIRTLTSFLNAKRELYLIKAGEKNFDAHENFENCDGLVYKGFLRVPTDIDTETLEQIVNQNFDNLSHCSGDSEEIWKNSEIEILTVTPEIFFGEEREINHLQPTFNHQTDTGTETSFQFPSQSNQTEALDYCREKSQVEKAVPIHAQPLKYFQCSECSHTTNSQTNLKKHIYCKHPQIESGLSLQMRFNCELCQRRFYDKRHLQNHQNSQHHNIRPYSCKSCEKCFFQEVHLNVHMKLHKKEKDHMCINCGKMFTLAHHLKRHHLRCEK